MTDYRPLSPLQVEAKLREVVRAMDDAVDEVRAAAERSAEAEHAYKLHHAQAWLRYRVENPSATVGTVDAAALVECADDHLSFLAAQHALKARVESNRILIAQNDALRSISAQLRSVT